MGPTAIRRRRRAVVAAAALGAALSLDTAPAAAQAFAPCSPAGTSCATVPVPLDRSGAVPGSVRLAVRRVAFGSPQPEVLVVLPGGPGAPGIKPVTAKGVLAPLLSGRDLVLLDPRGVGLSDPIACASISRATADACAASLGPARAFYRSVDTADDLEVVRRALGVERLAVYAGSYGAVAAYDYASRYPDHTAWVVLDSPVPPHGFDPLGRSAASAVPRVLRSICRLGCHGIDPVADMRVLALSLGRAGARGTLVLGDGRRRRTLLRESGLWVTALEADRNPPMRAALPAAVHAALAGDMAPLVRLNSLVAISKAFGAGASPFNDTINYDTLCEETPLPWARDAPLDAKERMTALDAAARAVPRSVFGPFDPLQYLLGSSVGAQCVMWPQTPRVTRLGDGPVPTAPVLVLAGEQELRTPLEDSRALARSLPRGQLVVAEYSGHVVLGGSARAARPCVDAAAARFVAGGTASTTCRARSTLFPPSPVPPPSLARVAPLRGLTGTLGRTLAAVVATLADAQDDLAAAANEGDGSRVERGGLRGGRMSGPPGHVTLRRVTFVPGVNVSWSLDIVHGTASVRVTGRGARGHVTLGPSRLKATLGRRKISLPRPARPVDLAP